MNKTKILKAAYGLQEANLKHANKLLELALGKCTTQDTEKTEMVTKEAWLALLHEIDKLEDSNDG